jgi:hypothetical protein
MTDARSCRVGLLDIRRALLIALALGLVACASGGQRSLRDGTLHPGIGQKAFVTEWGLPERTLSVVSAAQLATRWGVAASPASPSRRPLDLWVYEKHGVEAVFNNGDLVAWKSDRSAEQLRALRAPEMPAGLYHSSGGQESLMRGILRVDIGQKAFRQQWGEPDRETPVGSLADLETRWGPEMRGSVLKGRRTLDIWVYEKNQVELLFDDGDLAAWKTRKTTEELRALLKRQ